MITPQTQYNLDRLDTFLRQGYIDDTVGPIRPRYYIDSPLGWRIFDVFALYIMPLLMALVNSICIWHYATTGTPLMAGVSAALMLWGVLLTGNRDTKSLIKNLRS